MTLLKFEVLRVCVLECPVDGVLDGLGHHTERDGDEV